MKGHFGSGKTVVAMEIAKIMVARILEQNEPLQGVYAVTFDFLAVVKKLLIELLRVVVTSEKRESYKARERLLDFQRE